MPHRTDLSLGDIFLLDWSPGRGSEQTGLRPGVIVQNNGFNTNPNFPNTVVVAVSKSGRQIPTHVFIPETPENGLWEPSYVKCEQIQTITKDRLVRYLGRLTDAQIAQVAAAVKRVLSLR